MEVDGDRQAEGAMVPGKAVPLNDAYCQAVARILDIPRFTSKNPLEHTRALLAELGDPQERFRAIHVAGSNGKGSVCAFLASVLQAAGKRVALFTSPHLVRMEERFCIGDGKLRPCSREVFVQAAARVDRAAAALAARGLPHPTFFEYIFAMGMVIFARSQVEYAVLETGLGGRLDATNVVSRPLLTVLTSISLEHTEILGDTIEKIVAEKAGILKAGVPVVYDASVPAANGVIEKQAEALGCPCYPVNPKKIKIFLNTGKKIDFSYDSGYDVREVEIPFGAPYQVQNASVALQALACLSGLEAIPGQAIRKGMAQVEWKGRMQEALPGVYLDGAHNLAGIERFLEAVGHISKDSAVLLFSMVKEKDYSHAAKRLLEGGRWEEIIVTAVPGSRGVQCRELAEAFYAALREVSWDLPRQGEGSHPQPGGMPVGEPRQDALGGGRPQPVRITEIEDIGAAFTYAQKVRRRGQALFCAGSLYLIGELERIAGGMQDD